MAQRFALLQRGELSELKRRLKVVINILNFLNGSVHIMPISQEEAEDTERFLWHTGFNPEHCQWLISEGLRLNIEI